jgi:glycosyltransferase involved in cell wall biosynthesis
MLNYTIIIPHKNIPHLLERCLKSIPQRNDLQIIVVDDNSDKDIPRLKELEGQFPNVEFVFAKNENGRRGAGYARNLGLERAEGKWLIFADADDFFLPDFEKALDEYKDDENEIIYFYVTSVNSDTLQPANRSDPTNNLLKKIQQSNDWDIALRMDAVWAKFIKRTLINEHAILFQEVIGPDDVIFSCKSTVAATKKILSDYELYCVTERQSSLMTDKTIDNQRLWFNVACQAVEFLKFYGKENTVKIGVEYWWLQLYFVNRSRAVLIFPKFMTTVGIKYIFGFWRRCVKNKLKYYIRSNKN